MFSKSLKSMKSRRGFTLIEIMIVVLIIGILLAIAVPNFVLARKAARTKACISNLKQIQSAKEQWAMDKKQPGSATPAAADLWGSTTVYINSTPSCPSTGAAYAGINAVDTNPVCPNSTTDGAAGSIYEHILP
jgi:prepilin-type N-terminal cleavage/methylation domain-containing protein